ncbi:MULTISPECIES: hypothetical protein [unclassified Rhodococcus (in: high G+C Gram-positive bacteria)]|nr:MULTISPECIES: hypothetical protein [unclassified Rhodococcus (in: high G+C Gram-positive bacteria)]
MPKGAARVGVVGSDERVVQVAAVGEGVYVGVATGGPFVDVVDL